MFRPDHIAPESSDTPLYIVFQGGKLVSNMRSPQMCLLEESLVQRDGWIIHSRHFMGYWHEQPCFAVEIDDLVEVDALRYQIGSLYQLLGRVDDGLAALENADRSVDGAERLRSRYAGEQHE